MALLIFAVEAGVELLLSRIPPMPTTARLLVDSISLLAVTFPAFYLLFFYPLRSYVAEFERAEAALRSSEERFRLAAMNSPDTFFFMDRDLRYTWLLNPNLPLSPEQVIGRADYDLFPVEQAAQLTETKRRALETGTGVRHELRLTSGGIERYYDAAYEPLRDEAGQIVGIAGCSRDITERRRLEKELRFRAELLDCVDQAVIATDQQGSIFYWNRFAEKLYGWPAAEATGRNIGNLVVPQTSREREAEIMSHLQVGERWSGEFLLQRRDGTTFPGLVITSPIVDDSGRVAGLIGVSIDITERKRTEEALRDSEARLRAILDNSPAAIYIKDTDSRFILVNPSSAAILDTTPDGAVGKTDFDLYSDRAIAERMITDDRLVIESGETKTFEEPAPRPDGLHTFVSVKFPLRDSGGKIYGVCGISMDITERKQAEKELERLLTQVQLERNRWEATVETIPAPVVVCDAEAQIIYSNRAHLELIGRPIKPGLPMDKHPEYYQFYRPDGALYHGKDLPMERAALRGEEVRGQEVVLRTPQGEEFITIYNASPLRDQEGRIVGAVAVGRDVTQQRKWEAERERLLAELDTTITSAADGVIIYSQTGEIVRMNPAAEHLLGFGPAERKLPLEERMALVRAETSEGEPFPPKEHPVYRALYGETVKGVVVVAHRPHGDVWLSVSAAPIRAADGTQLGIVSIVTDITALHELQEWLQDIIRTVSHDLRNPLTLIQAEAQLLLRIPGKPGPKGAERRSVEAIVIGAKRMNAMIEDLVQSVRLEAGQLRLEMQPVDLGLFVTDLLGRASEAMDVGRINTNCL